MMDRKALKEKYEELVKVHSTMAEKLKTLSPEAAKSHDSFARAYAEILGDLNK